MVAAIPVKELPSPLKLVAVITPALPNFILLPTSRKSPTTKLVVLTEPVNVDTPATLKLSKFV